MTDERTNGMLTVLAARRPTWPMPFRAVVVGCVAVLALGTLGAFAGGHLGGDWLVLLVLAVLFVSAEHRDRLFVDETGLSGSIAVATAAAMYFGASGRVGGAFVVCMVGGLYLPHLRRREWSKVVSQRSVLWAFGRGRGLIRSARCGCRRLNSRTRGCGGSDGDRLLGREQRAPLACDDVASRWDTSSRAQLT